MRLSIPHFFTWGMHTQTGLRNFINRKQMTSICAITYDLWDTVFIDDSDEPKRSAQGLPSKKEARRQLVSQSLEKQAPISRELVDCAYAAADFAFTKVWKEHHITWTVEERLNVVLVGLDRELPESEMKELVRQHEEMELECSPDLVKGMDDAIRKLSEHFKLVVISDAIFSPGRVLRCILAKYELEDCFDGFVFSDEAGCSKPDPRMFQKAAELSGCRIEEMVHIGDRESNDISGPQALGMRAVLFTGSMDRGSRNTRADAHCSNAHELPELIESMA